MTATRPGARSLITHTHAIPPGAVSPVPYYTRNDGTTIALKNNTDHIVVLNDDATLNLPVLDAAPYQNSLQFGTGVEIGKDLLVGRTVPPMVDELGHTIDRTAEYLHGSRIGVLVVQDDVGGHAINFRTTGGLRKFATDTLDGSSFTAAPQPSTNAYYGTYYEWRNMGRWAGWILTAVKTGIRWEGHLTWVASSASSGTPSWTRFICINRSSDVTATVARVGQIATTLRQAMYQRGLVMELNTGTGQPLVTFQSNATRGGQANVDSTGRPFLHCSATATDSELVICHEFGHTVDYENGLGYFPRSRSFASPTQTTYYRYRDPQTGLPVTLTAAQASGKSITAKCINEDPAFWDLYWTSRKAYEASAFGNGNTRYYLYNLATGNASTFDSGNLFPSEWAAQTFAGYVAYKNSGDTSVLDTCVQATNAARNAVISYYDTVLASYLSGGWVTT